MSNRKKMPVEMNKKEYDKYIDDLNLPIVDEHNIDEVFGNELKGDKMTDEEFEIYMKSLAYRGPLPDDMQRIIDYRKKRERIKEQEKQNKTKKTTKKSTVKPKLRIKKEIPNRGAESLI